MERVSSSVIRRVLFSLQLQSEYHLIVSFFKEEVIKES